MKIYLVRSNGKRLPAREPYPGADHAVLATDCPECGEHDAKVQGCGRRIASDDRAYEADAVAACCNRYVGTLRAETNTLFGLREDEAVLRQGVCIY